MIGVEAPRWQGASEGAYSLYVTEAQRSQRGWIGAENDRLVHSRALSTRLGAAARRAAGRPGRSILAAMPSDDEVDSGFDGTISAAPGVTAASIGDPEPGDYPQLSPVDRGHYQFDGVIARGGMGRILRARDRRLGREVAVKELITRSAQLVARFEREIRITARLQHPAIVSLHEAGTWSTGDPFYAMKLVAGRPLDAVIAGSATVAERLALLPHGIAVADALAYAHARGVIHRDLKPSNVLVGEFAETVVIDWGLAKDLRSGEPDAISADDRELPGDQTAYGSVIGTPAYMPPEQARGEPVDERADVYAIGALLYHLLAGRAPFGGRTTDEVIARVLGEAARPLGRVVPDAPPDLVAIVDKAMARRPEDRYPSARELADDLHRFHTGQLVGAHRYTIGALVRRWLRRHRAVVGVGAAALAVLAVVSVVGVRRVVAERDTARRAEQVAAAARALADDRRAEADAQRLASEDLVGFLLGDLHPQLERVGRLDLLHGVAARVDTYYARLTGTVDALDDTARARRAAALHVLGDVLDAAGDLDGARRALDAAIALREPLAAAGDPTAVVELARSRASLAVTLQQIGALDDADAELTRARAALAAAADRGPGGEVVLATVYRRLGVIAQLRGRYPDAVASLELGLAHARAALAAAPSDRGARGEIGKLHDRLADARHASGDPAGAVAEARAGLAIREALAAEDPGDLSVQVGLAVSWDKLFALAVSDADLEAAARAAAASLAVVEPLASRDPDNADWGRMHMVALLRGAQLASATGAPRRAVATAEAAVAVAERLAGRDPDNLDRAYDLQAAQVALGGYVLEAGDAARAIELLRRGLAVAQAVADRVPGNLDYRRTVGVVHELLGDALLAAGRAADAAAAYEVRIGIQEELLAGDPDNPRRKVDLAAVRFLRGRALAELAPRRAEGVAEMEAALAALRALADAGQAGAEVVAGLPEFEAQLARWR
jgi:tetratricopeptide (TPR) repeat protein